jgi:hypothetical protein
LLSAWRVTAEETPWGHRSRVFDAVKRGSRFGEFRVGELAVSSDVIVEQIAQVLATQH